MVLALEEIAEHLETLALSNRPGPKRESTAEMDRARLDNWENEGGMIKADPLLPNGIQRLQYDIFIVGPYRYTNLADAIAQIDRTNKHSLS